MSRYKLILCLCGATYSPEKAEGLDVCLSCDGKRMPRTVPMSEVGFIMDEEEFVDKVLQLGRVPYDERVSA